LILLHQRCGGIGHFRWRCEQQFEVATILSDYVDGLAESYFEGKAFARKGTTSSRH
jgi:hypothetical protein